MSPQFLEMRGWYENQEARCCLVVAFFSYLLPQLGGRYGGSSQIVKAVIGGC
jgi:hypothetical protein